MIPRRVKLKGFLCYKDEQEIDFDGNATLWMLSGLNGSGKSTIFDAVTYALFGHHRGGGQQAHELINKDSDGLARRVRLPARRPAVPRQAHAAARDAKSGAGRHAADLRAWSRRQRPTASGSRRGHRHKPTEFDAWVREHIGLNYETFTSSVLLLQGKAEKLLDSTPEGRREVLASIVDLERYEKLFRKADDQRKALEGGAEDARRPLGRDGLIGTLRSRRSGSARARCALTSRTVDTLRMTPPGGAIDHPLRHPHLLTNSGVTQSARADLASDHLPHSGPPAAHLHTVAVVDSDGDPLRFLLNP